MSALYSYSSSVISLRDCVFSALEKVINEHAILGVIPVDEDKAAPYFARLGQFDLRDVVTFKERTQILDQDTDIDPELDALLELEHNVDFKGKYGELPFWRLLIVHDKVGAVAPDRARFTACFFVHHAIGDGLSALAFHRSFLSALSSYNRNDASKDTIENNSSYYVTPPNKDLIPSLEDLHPLPISISYILSTVWQELMPRWYGSVWTAKNITNDPKMKRSRFKSFSVSPSSTAALIAVARTHETTVTGAMEAILAYNVFKSLPEQFTAIKVAGPISLRPVLPSDQVTDGSIGTWSNSYVEEHSRPSSTSVTAKELYIWDEARKVRETIKRELKKEGKNIRTALLKLAGDSHKFLQKNVGRARGESIELSNLGVFKGATETASSGWQIEKVLFSQAGNVVGSPLQVTMATGGDGCLNIGFSWLEGICDGDWVGRVVADVKHDIEDLAESGA